MRDSQKLSEIFFSLNESGQQSLLDYALFLTQQHKKDQTEFPEPELIQREEGETVIAAIKRLKKSYAMLNMDKLLNETSTFTAQYMLTLGFCSKNVVFSEHVKHGASHQQRILPQQHECKSDHRE